MCEKCLMDHLNEYLSSSSDDAESSEDEVGDLLQIFQVVNLNNRNGRGLRRFSRIEGYLETVIVRYNLEEFRHTFR